MLKKNNKFLLTGHNVGISAPHLLPANTPHVKNCTNLIAGSGNGTINNVGNRLPQGNNIKIIYPLQLKSV